MKIFNLLFIFLIIFFSSCRDTSLKSTKTTFDSPFPNHFKQMGEPNKINRFSYGSFDAIYRFTCGNGFGNSYICITFCVSDLSSDKKVEVIYKELFNDEVYCYELPNSVGRQILYNISNRMYYDEIFSLPVAIEEDAAWMVNMHTDSDKIFLERLNNNGYRYVIRSGHEGAAYLFTKDLISAVKKHLPQDRKSYKGLCQKAN